MKSFVVVAVLLASAVAAQHHAPLGMRNHRRNFNALERRDEDEMMYRRAPLPQGQGPTGIDINIPGLDPTDSESSSTSQSTSISTSQSTSSSSTPNRPDPTPDPPSSSSTSTSTSTSTTPSQTSTTSTSTSTSAASTSNSQGGVSLSSRTSLDNYAGVSYTPGRSASVRTSTSGSSEETGSTSDSSGGGDFASNKAAVAATATVAALVALGALVFIAFWWKKKSKRNDLNDDMWDGASMKEFSDPSMGIGNRGSISAPPPAMRNVDLESEMGGGGALARSNTKVLPSQQQAAALARSRSTLQRENAYEEEPDVLLAMPPVAHYERPRDSAYDIVPAAPPMAAGPSGGYGYSNAYASGSGSGGLQPPSRKGDHTSFGSGLGSDPFAGTGFVDASRESTFGPGQAGRGAGYAAAQGGGQPMMDQGQWSQQQYNPYTGYSQHSPQGYGGGYGYAS